MVSGTHGQAIISVAFCTADGVDENSRRNRPLAAFDHFEDFMHWLRVTFHYVVPGRDILGWLRQGTLRSFTSVHDKWTWQEFLSAVESTAGSLHEPPVFLFVIVTRSLPVKNTVSDYEPAPVSPLSESSVASSFAALVDADLSVAFCTASGMVDETSRRNMPVRECAASFEELLRWLQVDFDFVLGRDVLGWLRPGGIRFEVVYDFSSFWDVLDVVRANLRSQDTLTAIEFGIIRNLPPADDAASGHTTADTTVSSPEPEPVSARPVSPKPATRRLSEMFATSSFENTENESTSLYGEVFPYFPAALSDADFAKAVDAAIEASRDRPEMIRFAIRILDTVDTMERRDLVLRRLASSVSDKGKGKAPVRVPTVRKPTAPSITRIPEVTRAVARKPLSTSTASLTNQSPTAGRKAPAKTPAKTPAKAKPTSTVDLKKAMAVKVKGTKTVDENYEKDESLDAPLGAYNTGDSMEEWAECLDFFCVDANDYLARTEGFGGLPPTVGSGARKRAGMKKLFGMTVSLFDYQLMGVFRLIKQVTRDCHGGFLADACGVGKTVEMLGVLATASALRRMLAEVKVAARGSVFDNTRHLAPGAAEHAKCPSEKKYGIRCPCHCALSRRIVAMLPEGPNLMLTPTKTAPQLFQEAKLKLDSTKFQVRLEGDVSTKDHRLSNGEIGLSRGSITGINTSDHAMPKWLYAPPSGSDHLVVVVPYPQLTNVQHVFDEITSEGIPVGTLVPGIVFADEFHEVVQPSDGVMSWLRNQRECAKDQLRPPTVFFTSATPIESSPIDLAEPLSVLEKPVWSDSPVPHAMAVATCTQLIKLDVLFRTLMARQSKGEVISRDETHAYRERLDRLLNAVMVRRLATDTFRGRALTDLGPMAVTIQHCAIPERYKADVQALSDLAMRETRNAVTDGHAESVAELLASREGSVIPAVVALRVAATFPATAAPLRIDPSLLSDASISRELRAAGGDIRKTSFWSHIASWTKNSTKLAAVLHIAQTMANDNSPIEGESTRAKKMCIFTATEAEAMLLFAFLQQARAASPQAAALRPVWLHPAALPPTGATLLDHVVTPFQTFGHHTPNVLVASMARAGTGLNFPQAKYCVVTGPGLRKSDTTQVFGRCHRVRQKQRTQLHLLVARGNPLERRIYDAQRGVAAPAGEDGWAVAVEGEVIPGGDEAGREGLEGLGLVGHANVAGRA